MLKYLAVHGRESSVRLLGKVRVRGAWCIRFLIGSLVLRCARRSLPRHRAAAASHLRCSRGVIDPSGTGRGRRMPFHRQAGDGQTDLVSPSRAKGRCSVAHTVPHPRLAWFGKGHKDQSNEICGERCRAVAHNAASMLVNRSLLGPANDYTRSSWFSVVQSRRRAQCSVADRTVFWAPSVYHHAAA